MAVQVIEANFHDQAELASVHGGEPLQRVGVCFYTVVRADSCYSSAIESDMIAGRCSASIVSHHGSTQWQPRTRACPGSRNEIRLRLMSNRSLAPRWQRHEQRLVLPACKQAYHLQSTSIRSFACHDSANKYPGVSEMAFVAANK